MKNDTINMKNLKTETKARTAKKGNDLIENYESMNIGFYLATPLLLGVFLGLFLDRSFHTKPFFTIALIVLGAVGSFYNLYKLVKEKE